MINSSDTESETSTILYRLYIDYKTRSDGWLEQRNDWIIQKL